MFSWSIINFIEMFSSLGTLYFSYAFLEKKDISFKYKIIAILPIILFMLLSGTMFNLKGFDSQNCEAEQGILRYYFYAFEIFVFLSLVFYLIRRIVISNNSKDRRVAVYFSIGVVFFLASFSGTNIIASITQNWEILEYGLFGMPIFMAFLAYLIVEYKAFEIKLAGAQALVIGLSLLICSQFFFIRSQTNIILTAITAILSILFGYILVRSVKREIQQKEALEIANRNIVERNEQLQVLTGKLASANEQLLKLDAAKTEFISIASHQLRTPITAIKGFVSLVLEGSYGEISPGVQDALKKVYISSERLVHLIEDLLNISRIESGRMIFEFEKAEIGKLLEELHENFLLIANQQKFYLNLKLPAEPLPQVTMDSFKIRELVSNFIDNALKYTEKGGVEISAEVRDSGVVVDENGFVIVGKKTAFGKVVRITVADTGIGVPKDEIPNLFKKFSRGKDVSRLHAGGTGLGLYVGKAIAQAHHGQVWVESAGAGLGSQFIIEIPIEHQ
ncbi:MAG: ATP-binding protein, partial [Candidatus Moraniibacteriota bacterium]